MIISFSTLACSRMRHWHKLKATILTVNTAVGGFHRRFPLSFINGTSDLWDKNLCMDHGPTNNAITRGLLTVILIIPGLCGMIHHAGFQWWDPAFPLYCPNQHSVQWKPSHQNKCWHCRNFPFLSILTSCFVTGLVKKSSRRHKHSWKMFPVIQLLYP